MSCGLVVNKSIICIMIEAIFFVFLITSIIMFIIQKKYLTYIPNKIYKIIDHNSSKILLHTIKLSKDDGFINNEYNDRKPPPFQGVNGMLGVIWYKRITANIPKYA